MFKAALFLYGKEYTLLSLDYEILKKADINGRPATRALGGMLATSFASTKNDTALYEAMFSKTQLIKGYIRVYKRNGLQKSFDIEFANATVVYLKEHFNAESSIPLIMYLVISPQIQRIRDTIFELPANPSNPFTKKAKPIEREALDDDLIIIASHFEDLEGNVIEEIYNGKIVLVIETQNGSGKKAHVDLSNKEHGFVYQGKRLEDDRLLNLSLTGDLTRIELEAIDQHLKDTAL